MDPVVDQTPTLASGFGWVFHFVGDIAFKWIPATVVTLGNTGNPPEGVGYAPPPLGGPATAQEASVYLHAASDPGIYSNLVYDWTVFTALSLFVSLLLGALVVYCIIRILQIRKHEHSKWDAAQEPAPERDVSRNAMRWRRIVEEVGSEPEQNWRLAILEADIMLGDLLDSLGYKGETMADKMRAVERANFNSIDLAWEAHRARNGIAHQGRDVPLSSREARRIIGLYEKIFREFRFIT